MKTVFENSPPSPAGEILSPFVTRQVSGSVFQQPNVTPSRTADAKRYKFLRRFVHFRHMDFEYALWQMLHLFISPQKVYRNFAYRKQTKDQWARDDPAFLVLLSFWLLVSSVGFAIVLRLSIVGFFKFLIWVVFVDCIAVGICVATLFWYLTNHHLILQPPRGQDVEWAFCFDVHLNAFFPLLMTLHLFQLPFLNAFINQPWFISCAFGNTLWLIATGYYVYITFLGYSSLPFLKNTQVILYPLTVLLLIYIVCVLIGWNLSRGLCHFYAMRV